MDESVKELLGRTLRQHGYSVTKARQSVFSLMWRQKPQSMRELLKRADGNFDRTSLYRTIHIFEKTGIVQRIYIGWKYKLELTDIFTHHHHHISCIKCGKLLALKEDDELERLIKKLALKNNMTEIRHQLEIQGYCLECAKTKTR